MRRALNILQVLFLEICKYWKTITDLSLSCSLEHWRSVNTDIGAQWNIKALTLSRCRYFVLLFMFIKKQYPGQRILQRVLWDPSVGIRRNLSVGFDQPLLLISSFNNLVLELILEAGQHPPIGSIEFQH